MQQMAFVCTHIPPADSSWKDLQLLHSGHLRRSKKSVLGTGRG